MHIAIVTVPFFLTDQHLRWAQAAMSSIIFEGQVTRIGIANRLRNSKEEHSWFNSAYDIFELNDRNNLSRAWNRGIKYGLRAGADYIVVMNLDIILHPQCLNNLVAFAQGNSELVIWSAVMWHNRATLLEAQLSDRTRADIHWSCFMLNRRLPELVGDFDEGFDPAYFEDADMRRRIALKGLHGGSIESALFYHLENGTIKGCMDGSPEEVGAGLALMSDLKETMDRNEQRFIKKWGGLPYQEKFTEPFGRS